MKRILVAIASSPHAAVVLAAASHLAELAHASLIASAGPPLRGGRCLAALRPRARRRPRSRSIRAARATRADVAQDPMGRHLPRCPRARRRSDRDRLAWLRGIDHLLGTVAAKVVNHADRNVLVVRTAL